MEDEINAQIPQKRQYTETENIMKKVNVSCGNKTGRMTERQTGEAGAKIET